MRKHNKTERAAIAVCERIRANGTGAICIVWVRSRTWGSNPNVQHYGTTIGRASGCGYNKESAALADALRFLGTTEEEQRAIWTTSGAGVSSLQCELEKQGWTLTRTYSGQNEDGYTIERIKKGATE